MKLFYVRHGKTKGNAEKIYIGRTESRLLPEGIEGVERMMLAPAGVVPSLAVTHSTPSAKNDRLKQLRKRRALPGDNKLPQDPLPL